MMWVHERGFQTSRARSSPTQRRTDLTIVGAWPDAIRAARAQRRGEEYDAHLEFRGDPEVLETVGPAFAAAQQVATVEVAFPELSDK